MMPLWHVVPSENTVKNQNRSVDPKIENLIKRLFADLMGYIRNLKKQNMKLFCTPPPYEEKI